MKMKKKQELPDIFIRGRKLTLGVKLVGTFAFTFYLLYFLLLTVFGFFYRSVYDPAYSEETLFKSMFMSANSIRDKLSSQGCCTAVSL